MASTFMSDMSILLTVEHQHCLVAYYMIAEHVHFLINKLLLQPATAATGLDDDSDYIVSDGNSAEDLLDDSNDAVSDLPAPPVSVSAPTQRLPSNQECGAEVALQLLAFGIDLFGSATAQDYEQMLQVRAALVLFSPTLALCMMLFTSVRHHHSCRRLKQNKIHVWPAVWQGLGIR